MPPILEDSDPEPEDYINPNNPDLQLDLLIADLGRLNMAQIPVLAGDHLKVIPEFKGEVELLPEFISISEKLVNHFYDPNNVDCFQNIWLMSSLKSKVQGDAKINLSSYAINTWQDLKNALLATYSDKRDAYTLTIELCNLTQGNKTPFEFHNEIQKLINLHNSYLTTHNMDEVSLRNYIAKLGLRTLLKGLKEPLGSLMRTKNPDNLGEALNMLTNDFQVDTTKSRPPVNQPPKPFRPNNMPRPFIPFRPNPQPFRQNYTFDPNRFRAGPSQPQNSVPYNRNFNNSNMIQNRQNQNQHRPLPRPTPMSGVQTIRNNNLHHIVSGSIPDDTGRYDHDDNYYDYYYEHDNIHAEQDTTQSADPDTNQQLSLDNNDNQNFRHPASDENLDPPQL